MTKISFMDILCSHGSWSIKSVKIIDYVLGSMIAWILPQQISLAQFQGRICKILVIRPGGIGDAVFLLPILKVLKEQGVLIDILCETRNAEVFSSQGYSVYRYDRLSSFRQVFSNTYDVVVDTEQWHYLSAIVSYFSKTTYRVGFATRKLRAKLFNQCVEYGNNDYELDNFLRLFEGLLFEDQAIKNINDCAHVSADLKLWASKAIPQESVAVFVGSSVEVKRLSKEQLSDIIKNLLVRNICPVLLGGKDVLAIACQIMTECKGKKIFSFVGQISLSQSVALIHRSQKFIGPDSGLMHWACAVGASVDAVFGPSQLEKWQPKGAQHRVITEQASCSPCARFSYTLPTCHQSYHCMKNIKFNGSR